ncbi:histidinol-phosphatase [Desulfitibacter alkalitolerans]|uniref:histidinol-phosphatase n=1 Tax=Desulfitibacter alkalitolerans TaxID=264641 RepID=UPI00047F5580|nr:histidinol-phosphatase [Desulfitibacter alkalitolerans]
MTVDYHVHSLGHGDRKHIISELRPFLDKAKTMGLKDIGFADHDRYLDNINFKNYEELSREYSHINIRVGLEFEYFPHLVYEMSRVIQRHNFDYTIGSVHFLGDWNFDHPDHMNQYKKWNVEDFYTKYFQTVLGCIETGLFNIAGHIDLAKVFNYRVEQTKVLKLIEPVLAEIKLQSMAMEINTGGLYKPVNEIYPSMDIIKMAVKRDIPLTISSDAHRFEDVGRNSGMVVEILKELGVKWVAGFNKGHMVEIPLD